MSIRSRNLLLLLGMLGFAAMTAACDGKKPTDEGTDTSAPELRSNDCQQNPNHCSNSR